MLILRKEAEEDVKAAYEWYEAKSEALGAAFISEVGVTLQAIEENPKMFQKVAGDVCRALCKRFPYSIYFVVRGPDISVIAVLHQRRSPAAWQSRG